MYLTIITNNLIYAPATIGSQRRSTTSATPLYKTSSMTRRFDGVAESTCQHALHSCEADVPCRQFMELYDKACAGDGGSHDCDRHACMLALQRFYLLVPRESTYALLFCRCKRDDVKCDVIAHRLRPTCIRVESPTPSCDVIMTRCRAGKDCRCGVVPILQAIYSFSFTKFVANHMLFKLLTFRHNTTIL